MLERIDRPITTCLAFFYIGQRLLVAGALMRDVVDVVVSLLCTSLAVITIIIKKRSSLPKASSLRRFWDSVHTRQLSIDLHDRFADVDDGVPILRMQGHQF